MLHAGNFVRAPGQCRDWDGGRAIAPAAGETHVVGGLGDIGKGWDRHAGQRWSGRRGKRANGEIWEDVGEDGEKNSGMRSRRATSLEILFSLAVGGNCRNGPASLGVPGDALTSEEDPKLRGTASASQCCQCTASAGVALFGLAGAHTLLLAA